MPDRTSPDSPRHLIQFTPSGKTHIVEKGIASAIMRSDGRTIHAKPGKETSRLKLQGTDPRFHIAAKVILGQASLWDRICAALTGRKIIHIWVQNGSSAFVPGVLVVSRSSAKKRLGLGFTDLAAVTKTQEKARNVRLENQAMQIETEEAMKEAERQLPQFGRPVTFAIAENQYCAERQRDGEIILYRENREGWERISEPRVRVFFEEVTHEQALCVEEVWSPSGAEQITLFKGSRYLIRHEKFSSDGRQEVERAKGTLQRFTREQILEGISSTAYALGVVHRRSSSGRNSPPAFAQFLHGAVSLGNIGITQDKEFRLKIQAHSLQQIPDDTPETQHSQREEMRQLGAVWVQLLLGHSAQRTNAGALAEIQKRFGRPVAAKISELLS